jgi:penicillin-binding protein 1A
MTVFTWKGEKDTIMTPMDSIRYYKHFLQSDLWLWSLKTGHKSLVGGIDYKYFQYTRRSRRKLKLGSFSFTLRRLNN